RPEALAEALEKAGPRPQSGDNGQPALDASALDSLRELGGEEFVAELAATFLADAPEMLATLRRSLENGHTDELRRAAHTLKSNGGSLGGGEFSELWRELEERAKTGELDGAGELVGRIEQEYAPFRDALEALRGGASA